MLIEEIDVAGRRLGLRQPCFIIAEAGVNHNGSVELACQLVNVAVEAGADAVKFQTFQTERLVTQSAPKADYQSLATGAAESQYAMLKRLELSPESHQHLVDYCRRKGILFMSTPFDEESADLLESLGVVVFKIGSGEITNLGLLVHVACKQRPMIVSTGMSTLGEVEAAVDAIDKAGNKRLILLHCVSNYPAEPANANLRAMQTLRTAFQLPVGYSDHTPGIEVSLAAVALGACVIEKHFTLDRSLPGPDQQSSLEPGELVALVKGIRTIESALGHGRKQPAASEAGVAAVARKSLVAARDIPAGTLLTDELIGVKRPGTGLAPVMRSFVTGRIARVTIPAGTLLTIEMIG